MVPVAIQEGGRSYAQILLIVSLLVVTLLPAVPAEAHRRRCLPGELRHRQCHKVFRKARDLGYSKRYILRRIYRHERKIASLTPRRKSQLRSVCMRNCGPMVTGSSGWKEAKVYGLLRSIIGVELFRVGFRKKWCWNDEGKVKPLSRCGYVRPFYDVTNWGVWGWDYKGIQDRYDKMRDNRTKHTSMRQPQMKMCGPGGWPCLRDYSPRLYVTGRGNGSCSVGKNDEWRRC